jgi:hypothetical protein
MKNKKILVNSYFDTFRVWLTITAIAFTFYFPIGTYGQYCAEKRNKELLRKYYTDDEIESQNIHFVEAKGRILLSNGIQLPHDDLLYYQQDTPIAFTMALGMVGTVILLDMVFGKKNIKFLIWWFSEYDHRIRSKIQGEIRWQFTSHYKEILREKIM